MVSLFSSPLFPFFSLPTALGAVGSLFFALSSFPIVCWILTILAVRTLSLSLYPSSPFLSLLPSPFVVYCLAPSLPLAFLSSYLPFFLALSYKMQPLNLFLLPESRGESRVRRLSGCFPPAGGKEGRELEFDSLPLSSPKRPPPPKPIRASSFPSLHLPPHLSAIENDRPHRLPPRLNLLWKRSRPSLPLSLIFWSTNLLLQERRRGAEEGKDPLGRGYERRLRSYQSVWGEERLSIC